MAGSLTGFYINLLADLLGQRLRESPRVQRKGQWLFPADSKSGHIAEVAQHELDGPTGHALRHTYATLALQAGVPIAELSSCRTTRRATRRWGT